MACEYANTKGGESVPDYLRRVTDSENGCAAWVSENFSSDEVLVLGVITSHYVSGHECGPRSTLSLKTIKNELNQNGGNYTRAEVRRIKNSLVEKLKLPRGF